MKESRRTIRPGGISCLQEGRDVLELVERMKKEDQDKDGDGGNDGSG